MLAGGERKVRHGLTGARSYLSYYGVSAVDGTVRFLDLPLGGHPGEVGSAGQVVLSPDGRRVAYVRDTESGEGSRVVVHDWAVYDSLTGRTEVLKDPESPTIRGGEAFEMAFTGDSRFLVTDYSRTRPATNRTNELVAWDVRTGELHPVEPPGGTGCPTRGRGRPVWSSRAAGGRAS